MKDIDPDPIWKETRKGTALVSFSRGSRPARRLILYRLLLSLLMNRSWIGWISFWQSIPAGFVQIFRIVGFRDQCLAYLKYSAPRRDRALVLHT
jgi:hypothetical protein